MRTIDFAHRVTQTAMQEEEQNTDKFFPQKKENRIFLAHNFFKLYNPVLITCFISKFTAIVTHDATHQIIVVIMMMKICNTND